MTERESKEFYDDLRRKLESYGSAPPESVWTGIRQQVPAQPRRWWRGTLLALLLTAIVAYFTVSTRPWRPTPASKPIAVQPAGAEASGTAPSNPDNSRRSVACTEAKRQSVDNKASYSGNHTVAVGTVVGQSTPAATGTEALQPTASHLNRGRNTVSVAATAGKKRRTARQLLTADSTTEHHTAADATAPANAGAAQIGAASRIRRPSRIGIAVGVAPTSGRYSVRRQPNGLSSKTISSTSTSQDGAARPEQAEAGRTAAASAAAQSNTASPSSSVASAAASYGGMQPLLVWLQVPAWPIPQPSNVAVTETQTQTPAQPKWALQVLAGPAISYRTLGDNARRTEQLERPAAGYNAQLGVTRTINPRLSFSLGIGYTETATSLYLRLQKADSIAPATIRFRDYYRLLTVPVEAQYLLGTTARWRYGIQGGAAPALLLSARTTEGGTCNCQQQQWQPSDSSPFRRVNLTLTGGGFVGYQATPGLWLTLRPQVQYFLNSITEPTAGRTTRHPWSVGVQGGISFGLPSKR